MYKAKQTKRYYFAIETFSKKRKTISKVYYSGFRVWNSDDMKTFSIVIYTFRMMFGVKNQGGCICN